MNKLIKKFGLFFITVTSIISFNSIPAFATTNNTNNFETEIKFSIDSNGNVVSSDNSTVELTPIGRTTVEGNIGYATVKWVDSKHIYWKLTSKRSSARINFRGTIDIRDVSTNKLASTLYISAYSKGSYAKTERLYFNLPRNRTYIAKLNGTGTIGRRPFSVVRGCHETYHVY